MASSSLWQRFQRYFLYYRDLDFSLDISRLKFPEDFFEKMQPKIGKAFAAMRELEAGAIANPTEKRMVGHYWLRNPAPGRRGRRRDPRQRVPPLVPGAADRDRRLGAWTATGGRCAWIGG